MKPWKSFAQRFKCVSHRYITNCNKYLKKNYTSTGSDTYKIHSQYVHHSRSYIRQRISSLNTNTTIMAAIVQQNLL